MLQPSFQPNLLGLLHIQHRYYTGELGQTHRALGRQYNKLAKIELELIERHERNLTRQDKKSLQWKRANARTAVKALESQQEWLRDYLSQCNDLIASYDHSVYGSPTTPWPAYYPTPSLPLSSPWVATPVACSSAQQYNDTPHYWDLSMLHERRDSSPSAPSGSADSGSYEPRMYTHFFGAGEQSETDHVFFHGFMNPFATNGSDEATIAPLSMVSSVSSAEKADVLERLSPATPVESGAEEVETPRKRRYSENAIQLIESRLLSPKAHHRGNSTGTTPVSRRTFSVHSAIA